MQALLKTYKTLLVLLWLSQANYKAYGDKELKYKSIQ